MPAPSPVARLPSGAAIDYEQTGGCFLRSGLTVRDVQKRIAQKLDKPVTWISLVDPVSHTLLPKNTILLTDVQVVVSPDPEVEHEAEAAFLRVIDQNAMEDIAEVQCIEIEDAGLQALPESFAYNGNLQKLCLKNNKLKTLPEKFGHLIGLKTLDWRAMICSLSQKILGRCLL
jgi:Leucine-rich repeat (LRR) protein